MEQLAELLSQEEIITVMLLARLLPNSFRSSSFILIASLTVATALGAQPPAPARLSGKVHDADGKPVSGARVSISQRSADIDSPDRLTAVTGKDGSFMLPINTPPDKPFVVREAWAEKSGFVRAEIRERQELKAGSSVTLNFRLLRGDVLAGRVEAPLSAQERQSGVRPTDRQFILMVVGPYFPRLEQRGDTVVGITADGKEAKPAFVQAQHTAKGGNFKLWVPRGEYSIEVRALPAGRVVVKRVKVQSGSRNLVLQNQFLSEQDLAKAFDALWDEMDRKYSYFFLKKQDWAALRDRYRPQAVKAVGLYEFADVLVEMLSNLEDPHVWVATAEGRLSTYANPGRGNQNLKLTLAQLETQTQCGDFAVVGKMKLDGYGYFLLTRQSAATPETVRQAIKAIRELRDAPGFIVDLREANGGNENFAKEIASLFCGKETIYARSKYRNGKKHDAFGPTYDRVLPASDKPYLKPVVCLFGQRCVSSGEGFAQMMKCLPQVTTVGEPTRGASGNPQGFRLPGVDVTVWFSRWVDLMPDGSTFEGQGVVPEVLVERSPEDYQAGDPTLEKALEVLRQKIWESKK